MSPRPDFRLTAEHFNTALAAADITGLSVQDGPEGPRLDSGDLAYSAIVDKLLNGLVLLHYTRPLPEATP